ncbi:GAF domain-containing sensor histidine kinase [Streptomyces syringium]|uniref:GAF domain-containing sensor histidine kinase n=1 Tax=Streptomyces syringium TaxID=76729 RepID=UPI00341DFFCE
MDRFYYGDRARPYHVVRELAERLSQAAGPGEAPRLLCDAVVAGLRMPGAEVRIDMRGGSRVLAAAGAPGPGGTGFPLVYEGGIAGSLDVTPRPGYRVPDRQDQDVLRFLADQMAPAIASLRLYEDLRSAREQMVVAREDARRRLRLNLHDGLGPALSGVRLHVDTARYAVPDGSAAATPLATASEGIGQATSELRRIADGLTPAALDRLGLGEALRELADRLAGRLRVGVEFTPDPLPPLPAAVEVAVYLIGGEALNNVVRHSGADAATVTVRVVPDRVIVEVSDDGQGLPEHRTRGGVGLRSMEERAAELGGQFRIANGPGGGAVLHASFPPVAGPYPDGTDSG